MITSNRLGLLIVLCFFMSQSFAQKLSSIELSFAFPDSYDGVILSPSVQLDSKNHVWSVGPTLLVSYGDQIVQRESTKLTGVSIGYLNYLQGREDKFNLFFLSELWYQRIKDVQDSRFFDPGTSSFQSFEIEQVDNTLQFFLGFGLDFAVSDKISLKQSIGTGINYTSRAVTSPFSDFSDPLFYRDWMIETGILFRL